MQLFKLRTAVIAFASVAAVSACNDNNPPSTGPIVTPTPPPAKVLLTGRAALGPLVGASCVANRADGSTVVSGTSTQTTDSTGVFSFAGIDSRDFPIVVTCSGGSFFDEATSMTVQSLAPIKAVVPAARASSTATAPTVALTPLTNAAAATFLALPIDQRGGANGNNLAASANSEIAKALFPGGDILTPPTPVIASNTTLDNSIAGQYAAILAALSFAAGEASGATLAEKIQNFVSSLASDAADGTINGQIGTTPITNAGYTSFNELVQDVKDGTDSYETMNPNSSGGTNAVEAQEDSPSRDNTTQPSPSGS